MNPATATRARVLIVVDDPDAAHWLETLLLETRYQLIGSAGSGREAIRLAESTRPDLVIMDIVLPGDLDGIQTLLAERLDIPVLYLTAHSDEALDAHARATSPMACLNKPCPARELHRAIELMLDRHALLRRLKASEARLAEVAQANAHLQAEIENRLRMGEALWRNERRYRSLVDNLPEPILVMQDDQIVFANPALACLLGLPTAAAALGMSVDDLVHADSRQACESCKQATLYGMGPSAPAVLMLRRADGGSVEVEALTFAFDYEDRPGVLAVIRDLTVRRAMEQEAERFRVALDSSSDAVYLIDPVEMRFLDANATACASLGLSREELLRLGPQDIKPQFNQTLLRQCFAEVLAGHPEAATLPTLHQRRDGSTFPVEVQLRPFESAGKALVVAVARDISQRIRAEAELRETSARFQQMAENIDEAFWIRDLVTNRCLYANPAYERFYGQSVDSLYQNPASFLASVHPEDRERVAAAYEVQRLLPSGVNLEYRVVLEDRVRWMWVRTFPIRDVDGKAYRTVGVARDMTERRESEEQYHALIQASMDGFWMTDTQNHLVDCNDAYCRMSGYSREELLNLSISDLKISEYPDEVKRRTEHIMERGYDSFESRHRRKDGSEMVLEVSAYFRPGVDGGRLYAFLRDITVRKQAERALRESEERFATVFQAAPIGIAITRQDDGHIVNFNPAMLNLLGYERDELLGLTTQKLGLWAQPEQRAEALERLRRDGHVHNLELQVRNKFGAMSDGLVSMEPIDLNGEPHLLSLVVDITERKQAEEALRNSETRFRLLFEHSPIGIAMANLEGRFIQVNRALCDMLDYSAAELVGKTFIEITHPDDVAANLDLFRQSQEDCIPSYQIAKRYLHRDGSEIWVNLTSTLIRDQTGMPLYSLGMIENITERMNAERRRLAHEASQRDALVREVHHRIKNNLQGVIGLLRQHIADHPDIQSPIEDAIARINTIAVVHGLQSRMPQNELRLRELLHEVSGAAAALVMLPRRPTLVDALNGDVWLDSGASVTIALILNELIHNALKHGQHADGSGVELALSGDSQQATVRIVNPGGPLPTDFDLASGKGCGTGLDLIRTLLPRRGCVLTIRGGDGRIETELVLGPPLTTQPEFSA